jgi:hypothetical protein
VPDNRIATVLRRQAQANREEREVWDRAVLDALRRLGQDDDEPSVLPLTLTEELPAAAFQTGVRSAAGARRGAVRGRLKRVQSTLKRMERHGLVASRTVELPSRRRDRPGPRVVVYGAVE